jgi:protein-disulfide isomerase
MMGERAATLAPPVSKRDHLRGSLDAPVVMAEYGDFECAFCGQAYWVVKELEQALGEVLCVAFRHFPLNTVHPHAQHAAEAAEAAGAQGRFWEMHDMLFERQQALEDSDLVDYALALGLDAERFTRDMLEHRWAPRVREDFMSGVRSGVNGTPTFFINGVRHDGGFDPDSLLRAIEYAAERTASQPLPGYFSR